jgi:chromatin segregation and condensation protein Rec8/ScpA/Scc1 (kleisin family)
LGDRAPEATLSVDDAARLLSVPEPEARELADEGGRVPLEVVRDRIGGAAVALELALALARAREEVGRLSGSLKEVRAYNARLQREAKEATTERRRLLDEVLELRAAAEERLMLMERVEHIARVEQDLEESTWELDRLRNRGLLARLLNR